MTRKHSLFSLLCLLYYKSVRWKSEILFLWLQYPSEPRKSYSMRLPAEKGNTKEIEQYPSKSKRLLKALLSRRKSKKDEHLYTYLDEYWWKEIKIGNKNKTTKKTTDDTDKKITAQAGKKDEGTRNDRKLAHHFNSFHFRLYFIKLHSKCTAKM